MPAVKRKTGKSWRHPLRKPTARAVPSAVKQQANSDDGQTKSMCIKMFYTINNTHFQYFV